MWLLLVEDEPRLADSIRRGLAEEGFTVDVAPDAEAGARLVLRRAYDAIVVDRRLPGGDGLALVRRLRAAGRTEPVLVLTALDEVGHRVEGLDAGADDYLAKPFAFEELLARLRALLRRPPLVQQERVVEVGGLRLDRRRQRAALEGPRGEVLLNLRPKEYALLDLLLSYADTVVPRERIAERVWGNAPYVTDNALDVTVSGLRQRLADALAEAGAAEAPVIETVRGVGYCLRTKGGA